jgi:PEP-CTERM motif
LPATELSTPSAGLSAALAMSGFVPNLAFDKTAGVNGGSANVSMPHTFANLPANIVSAKLETVVRGGTFDAVFNDLIVLAFADGTTTLQDSMVFVRTFGPFAGQAGTLVPTPDPGLQPLPWGPIKHAFTLDLAALPTTTGGSFSILDQLNEHRFLDVVVADETAPDFYRLTVVTIPEPETYALLLAGLGLLGFARRRAQARSSRE